MGTLDSGLSIGLLTSLSHKAGCFSPYHVYPVEVERVSPAMRGMYDSMTEGFSALIPVFVRATDCQGTRAPWAERTRWFLRDTPVTGGLVRPRGGEPGR